MVKKKNSVQNSQRALRPRYITAIRRQWRDAPPHLPWSVLYTEALLYSFRQRPYQSMHGLMQHNHFFFACRTCRRQKSWVWKRPWCGRRMLIHRKLITIILSIFFPVSNATALDRIRPIAFNRFQISNDLNLFEKFNSLACLRYTADAMLSPLSPSYLIMFEWIQEKTILSLPDSYFTSYHLLQNQLPPSYFHSVYSRST